ncbi:retinol dehydrogenase 12 [Xylariales sp. PMI_506]|nr:retinol dehydrogenase 12 [Xylariales sp. PMI_506]
MSSSIDLPPLQELYIRRWLRGQFTKPVPPSQGLDLSGQTGIIIGGTDGIGLACVRVLLEHKLSRLILGARNMIKGTGIATRMQEDHKDAEIQVWELEMLSYDSVRTFAGRCASLERIDFVIIGAGIFPSDFRLSPSTGHEVTMQVHYWSTALLSFLLIPILKQKRASERPVHLTIINSDLAHTAELKERHSNPLLPAFDVPIRWGVSVVGERYNSCKMLIMMLVLKLKDVVDPTEVIINCLCPGMVKPTQHERDQSVVFRSATWLVRMLLGRSLEVAAWTYLDGAVEKGVNSHGSFLASWQISPFPKLMYTEEGRIVANRMWEETLKEFELFGVKETFTF